MVRKIFICIFVVMLLTTMVVPAFATSIGGSSTGRDNPSVVIDSIKLLNGTYSGAIADWPNNYGYPGGEDGLLVSYPFMTASCSRSETVYETTLYTGSASSIQLNCSNLFWTSSMRFLLDDDGLDNFCISTVSLSGTRNELIEQDGIYNIMPRTFSNTFVVNSTTVNFGHLIRQAVHADAYGDYVWFQDLKITINFYSTQVDSSIGLHFSVDRTLVNNKFLVWFRSQSIVCEEVIGEEFPGMFDWLKDSVQSFLDLEIAPGLTLNALFYVVLVIIILIAFIKILT